MARQDCRCRHRRAVRLTVLRSPLGAMAKSRSPPETSARVLFIMNEKSFHEVLTELDTITDLVDYLAAKEAHINAGCLLIIEGAELNLLGWYLFHGRSFPKGPDLMLVDNTVWQGITGKPEFQR